MIEHIGGIPSAAPVIGAELPSQATAGTRAQKLRSWDTIKYALLRAAHTWAPFSGTAWGRLSIIARQPMRAGSHHTPIHACPFKETLRYSTTMR